MPMFRTLAEASLYCEEAKCPFSWIGKSGTGYRVSKPKDAGKKKPKKRAKKRRAKKRRTKRSNPGNPHNPRKKRAKKRTTKKHTTKRNPHNPANPWGASIIGDTPRAKFMRSQKRKGRSPAQARAVWKLSHGRKKKRATKKRTTKRSTKKRK